MTSKQFKIQHRFVETIPARLKDGIVYVSIEYGTVVHKCCCGCGGETVTPLSPTDWKLMFDGETISLFPSVGNWSFRCESHYWIRENEVLWDRRWSPEEIEASRRAARRRAELRFDAKARGEPRRSGGLRRLFRWLDPYGADEQDEVPEE